METKEILILSVAIIAFGFSIYKKMNKKKALDKPGGKKSTFNKGGFPSQPDDYEPYSGK
jgi:hypothetical protein